MQRRARAVIAGAAAAGVAVVLRPGTHGNKLARQGLARARRKLRYFEGRLHGVRYRLNRRQPDPAVIDNVLADRIRSELGSLERQLDLPHIHVMVEKHVALLHGEVGSDADAEQIERRVAAVSGVAGVESYLRVGLTRGDSRPSSAVQPPSAALLQLREAAEGAGVPAAVTDEVLRGILATFADRLPDVERTHIRAHLPADVSPMFAPPRRISRRGMPRSAHDLVARIASTTAELPPERAEEATAAVLRTLRGVVPDEAADVAAVLPPEIRALWQGPSAA